MTATTAPETSRLGPLRNRNFRLFFLGYGTSLLGTGMAPVAVAFAVLASGGSTADLGLVIAGGVATNVLCLLAGGVVADRFGRRGVMIASDAVRLTAEGTFAALVLLGHPPVWAMVLLYAVHNVGYGFFTPAVVGLTPDIVEREQLQQANVLVGFVKDVGIVAGPAVAGVLIATVGPGLVLAVDAATYGVSLLSFVALRIPRVTKRAASSPLADLREGFGAWRGQSWIWITSVACALFNAMVYAPYLVLGPVVSDAHLGGGDSWGLIVAAQGAGSVLIAPLLLRWSPARPVVVILASLGVWALADVCLALIAPVPLIASAAFLGGMSLAIMNVLWTTMLQRKVRTALIGRVSSVDAVCSYALSPLGLVIASAVAETAGTAGVLWSAAVLQVVTTTVLLSLPAVRRARA